MAKTGASRPVKKESRPFVVFIGVALILLVCGFFVGLYHSTQLASRMAPLVQFLKQTGNSLHGHSLFDWMAVIFLNNLVVCIILMISGIGLGIYPAWKVWMNGLLLGYVTAMLHARGVPVWRIIVFAILPHGLFEIPAILLASAIGMGLGYRVLVIAGRALQGREPNLRGLFQRKTTVVYLLAMVGLLMIAAVIESAVTPVLISRFVTGA